MKFLKGIMARKREEETEQNAPAISIEALQRDLDHADLNRPIRDPGSAWGGKAAQRPADNGQAAHDGLEQAAPIGIVPEGRTVSRELAWDDALGDAGDAQLRESFDAPRARRQTRPVTDDDDGDEPEFGPADGDFDEFDDEDFDDGFDELDPEEERAIRDNALLVDEIRDAIAAVRHIETDDGAGAKTAEAGASAAERSDKRWEHDEVFGRKAIARDRLARFAEGEEGDRVFDETASKMFDDDAATRRRQAMAHLKAAAAATKADNVLKRVVGRDPAMDPDAQVQYREDLANVVRQRGPRSEPVSRPLSRPRTRPVPVEVAAAAQDEPAQAAMTTHQRPKVLAGAQNAAVARAERPQTDPEPTPENNELAEAIMDVEKIDLKTALERQKAILKAEREALEAEIAAADAARDNVNVDEKGEREAEDDLTETPVLAEPAGHGGSTTGEPELAEPMVADVHAEAHVPHEDPEMSDAWDDGLDEADATEDEDDDDGDAPVDVTALKLTDEPSDDSDPEDGDEMRDLELETGDASVDEDDDGEEEEEVTLEAAPAAPPRRAGRVKTRLLGFQSKAETGDVFAGKAATGAGPVRFPVGWLVVTNGKGFGHSFSLLSGVSKIGRGDDQAVQLDFGDTAISRDNHAAIAFDEELNQFFLGHGGKSNVVRLNGKPVLSTEELYDGDEIRIGETTLKFIALCCEDFTWAENAGDDNDHVRSA